MDLQLTNKKAAGHWLDRWDWLRHRLAPGTEGAAVVVNGRSRSRVEEAVQRIKKENKDAQVTGLAADLGTKEGVDLLTRTLPAGHPGEQPGHLRAEAVPRHPRRGLAAAFFEVNVLSGVQLSRFYLPGMLSGIGAGSCSSPASRA